MAGWMDGLLSPVKNYCHLLLFRNFEIICNALNKLGGQFTTALNTNFGAQNVKVSETNNYIVVPCTKNEYAVLIPNFGCLSINIGA